jgi:hypothetical protein
VSSPGWTIAAEPRSPTRSSPTRPESTALSGQVLLTCAAEIVEVLST